MKLCSCARKSFKHLRSRFALSKNEEGSFLVETLIAAVILLIIAATAVSQLTSLTKIKVQTETRDRAIAMANGLQENMQAAGCGFDVSTVKEGVKVDKQLYGNGSGAEADVQQPWSRVSSCAFSAIAGAVASGLPAYTPDQAGNISYAASTLAIATNFCNTFGIAGRCEMGDQKFSRYANLDLDNRKIKFDITVNYWFEKTGSTNSDSTCALTLGSGSIQQPDVIARKINIMWDNPSKSGAREDITVVKRQNIPADSIEFSASSRVGIYTDSATKVTMRTNVAGKDILQVTRDKLSGTALGNTTFEGGSKCLWFPYIDKDATPQTTFAKNGSPIFNIPPAISSTPSLSNGQLS